VKAVVYLDAPIDEIIGIFMLVLYVKATIGWLHQPEKSRSVMKFGMMLQ